MREEELETAIKVVIVGDGAVGKSSMIQRYCKGLFTKDYKKTIGVDFLERLIEVDAEDVRLMLWDTAGQEEFDAITKAYYRGAQACVVAFSLTDRKSLTAVESWLRKVEDEVGEGVPTALVLNKIDMLGTGADVVSFDEAESLASRLRLPLYRTSVKNNQGVDQVFHFLADKYLREINGMEESDWTPSPRDSREEDPWNRTTTRSTSSSSFHGNHESRPSNQDGRPSNNVTHSVIGLNDEFMANPPSAPSVSKPSRPRWRFRRSKRAQSHPGSSGSNTIVLAPSKRRTKGKKDLSLPGCALI